MDTRYNGTFRSGRKDGKLAYAGNIYDEDEEKMQSAVNKELRDLIGGTITGVVQTTTSKEDEGKNVITFTNKKGEQMSVIIRNGSQGIQGEKGDKGDQGDKGNRGDVGMQGPSGVADASNKTLVNDAVTGGQTDFLSAEVGKRGIMSYDCSQCGVVTYDTLQEAIDSVPSGFRKGGLSIYVLLKGKGQYLNYFLSGRDWSNNVKDWSTGSLGITQIEGESTIVAISQKAFTDAINLLRNEKFSKEDVEDVLSVSTDKVPTSSAVSTVINKQNQKLTSLDTLATNTDKIAKEANGTAENAQKTADAAKKTADANSQSISTLDTSLQDVKKKLNALNVPKLAHMTESAYEALESKDDDTYYFLTED